MKLVLLTFLCAAVGLSMAGNNDKDVNDLCKGVKCGKGEVCRIVEKIGKRRRSTARCVPCVEEKTDQLCNRYGYKRAVLIGPNRNLTPLNCHIYDVPNKFHCPTGSSCKSVYGTPGFGYCCYDKVEGEGPVSNDDPICSKCRPYCLNDRTCQPDVVSGKRVYNCQRAVKDGICPIYGTPYNCNDSDRSRKCEHDQDCEGDLKCCLNACEGTFCRNAYIFESGKK